MQMLPLHFKRAPTVAGAFCLMLATVLSGCASKNPLMEEPTPVATVTKPAKVTKPSPVAEPTPAKAEEERAAAPAASEPATQVVTATPQVPQPAAKVNNTEASSSTGMQVKHEKRFLGFFRPYRPDVQQGNFISQEMVAQLKEGMTQNQVVFLLGTPLLNDVFHSDRWDYTFRLQKGNGEVTTSRVTVFFKNGLVSSFEGGDLPTEADYLARIANKAKEAKNK